MQWRFTSTKSFKKNVTEISDVVFSEQIIHL